MRQNRCVLGLIIPAVCIWVCMTAVPGQSNEMLKGALQNPVLADLQTQDDVRRLSRSGILPIPEFTNAAEWQTYADMTRAAVLDRVVFRGEAAQQWRSAATRVEFVETIPGGPGYRIDKYRIEVLPGLWIPALLYLPDAVVNRTDSSRRFPVFLQVNGHDSVGKAADYKQSRCIHLARNGVVSLNLEWFGMGQLALPGYGHGRLNQLDLCGVSGLAPFYLAMSRGIDFLLAQEYADPARVGVAGLSGGGWQTILISSLDTRVTLCNPVAGYSSFLTRIDHFSDLGDSEQTPVDLGVTADYAQLTRLLAPRAALLTYNDKDNCCFASGHALPPLVQAASPIYQLLGADSRLRMHVNSEPGTHNFLIDNRQALYRMIRDQWFAGNEDEFRSTEAELTTEIKTKEELFVALPEVNQTFVTLAADLAKSLPRSAAGAAASPTEDWKKQRRQRLQEVTQFQRWKPEGQQHSMALVGQRTVLYWQVRLGADWTVPVVEISPEQAQKAVLLVADGGRGTSGEVVEQLLNEGYRVFVLDPFGIGESQIRERAYLWNLMISTIGKRPLGIQAGQVVSTAAWICESRNVPSLSLMTVGPRSSVIGLVAAALTEQPFENLHQREPLTSLKTLLSEQASFEQTPELFCFGLLEQFDIPELHSLLPARDSGTGQ